MKRGGTVLVLAITLVLAVALTAAARDGTGTADVFLKQQGDEYFAGEDLLSADGVGQSRSLIVSDHLVILVKVQNDGADRATFTVTGAAAANGFSLRYITRGRDVTDDIVAGELSLDISAGKKRAIRVELDASAADFAAEQLVLVSAVTDEQPVDAARAKVTKI